MIDNFLPTFDMASEKEIKKDFDIDSQINKIKEDILNKKDFIFYKKPFTDTPNIEEILESTMTNRYNILVGEAALIVRFV